MRCAASLALDAYPVLADHMSLPYISFEHRAMAYRASACAATLSVCESNLKAWGGGARELNPCQQELACMRRTVLATIGGRNGSRWVSCVHGEPERMVRRVVII